MKEEATKVEAKLNLYHSVDQFEDIARDLLARDLCLLDSCLFRRGKQPSSGRVESNLLFIGDLASN